MNKEDALRFEMIKAAAYRTEQRKIGKKEQLEESIKTMSSNGLTASDIAKYLSLELSLVKEVLEKK